MWPLARIGLQASGAVLIEGPKACGKTETACGARRRRPWGAIVAGGYGYVRDDGVQVVPITSLGT